MLIKDLDIYDEAAVYYAGNKLMFGEGILASEGHLHRRDKKILSPMFSVNELRGMVPLLQEIAHKVRRSFEKQASNGPVEVDSVSWMTRIALELIAQTALGYSFDTLEVDSIPHPYSKAVKNLLPLASDSMIMRAIVMPPLVKFGYRFKRLSRFFVDLLAWKTVKILKDVIDVMDSTSREILELKRKALDTDWDDLAQGKDIFSRLIFANSKASEKDKMTDTELLGQVNSLAFASTDTSSGVLSRILHILARDQAAQDRLRDEVRAAHQAYGNLRAEQLTSLPFLDAVYRETLRLHPPVSHVPRTAVEDTVLPLYIPLKGYKGEDINQIFIPKGTEMFISMLSANRNPAIWGPDSYEWKPERWLNPLPTSVTSARIPGLSSHITTFLAGGRGCLGFKFAELEIKTVLTVILETIRVEPAQQNVMWQLNILATPNVDPESKFPKLPLKISLAKGGEKMNEL
ncbi:cytochrome P450 [Panaeolus papilionaceus]|nr:cytochrome P450 [Panaeolus papilionaceus]